MFTLDTNGIIYYLKDDPQAAPALEDAFLQGTLYISAITEAELFSFSNLSSEEITRIEDLLDTLAVISVDSRIARIAGELRRTYRTKLIDSIIAATALHTRTTLLTRNVRDFRKIPSFSLKPI